MKFKIRVVAVNDNSGATRGGLSLEREYERLNFVSNCRNEKWSEKARVIEVSHELAENSEFKKYFENKNFISMYVDIAHFKPEDFDEEACFYVLDEEALTEKRLLELFENKRNINLDRG